MQEKTIEMKLVQAVKEMGGIAPKFLSPGLDGMPDRLVLLPFGRVGFLVMKCHGKKVSQIILQEVLERGVFSHFQWYGTLTQIEPDYLNGRWRKEREHDSQGIS